MNEQREASSPPCSATEADWGFGTSSTLCVLVLAGGQGMRMGGAKPERLLGGHRLVDHALHIARRNGGRVAVGLRAPGQVQVEGAQVVLDESGVEGPVASLAAGLNWARENGVDLLLTLPCDAPFLPRDLGVRLNKRLELSGDAAALATSHGRTHPSCGLWRTGAIASLSSYLSSGRRSLIGFAEHIGYVVEDWGAPERDPFFNINTPEELEMAATCLS